MVTTMLIKEAFEASRRFVETNARALDVARFHHAFDGGSAESVFDALRRYQNADGGFGHALEADLRIRESSALCSSVAFQIIRSIHTEPDEALVLPGIAYFLKTLDRETVHWRIIPRLAEQCPGAPWWDQTGREGEFDRFSLNPTAEILGYLYDYQEHVPGEILSLVSDQVVRHLSSLKKIEMHELLCCLRLLQSRSMPGDLIGKIRLKVDELIDRAVAYDPAQWKGYGLTPLQVVTDPASPFLAGRENAVDANLDFEISSRNADGSWAPNWTWGEAFPDEWMDACREWAGNITLEKLLLLKRFKRIEGIT